MTRKTDNPAQQFLPILGELINRGDGTFAIRPTLPDDAGDTWVSAKLVKTALKGDISVKTIYRYADWGVIKSRHPTPSRVEFSLKSVMAFKLAMETDPEFWSKWGGKKAIAKPLQGA